MGGAWVVRGWCGGVRAVWVVEAVWRQCGGSVEAVCRRPGRRRREIARLRGKSPSPRLCHGRHRDASRPGWHPSWGCSGGLIMLGSAWKREGSPVARVRSCGQIAGRLRADCGRLWGDCAGRLRGEIAGESEGCWCGWGWCACGWAASSDTAKENDHSRPRPSHLSLSKVRGFFTASACVWVAGGSCGD